MDVETISHHTRKPGTFHAIRSCCIQRGLCFKCSKPCNTTHIFNGQKRCPNLNTTFSEKINPLKKVINLNLHQVVAVNKGDEFQHLDNAAWRALGDEELEQFQKLVGEYLAGWSGIIYPSDNPPIHTNIVSSINIEAGSSMPRCLIISFGLKVAVLDVPVLMPMATVSVIYFVDVSYSWSHRLQITHMKLPVQFFWLWRFKEPDRFCHSQMNRLFICNIFWWCLECLCCR